MTLAGLLIASDLLLSAGDAAAQPLRAVGGGQAAVPQTGSLLLGPTPGGGRPTPRLPALAATGISPGEQCRAAIAAAQRGTAIPEHLLAAIGRVESGRRDPQSGSWHPWPWTINAEGQGFFYDTKAQAIAAVKALQARGVRSIDVGCMQVNLMHHPDAFRSLEDAFDPRINAIYASRFLGQLFAQTGSWQKAVAYYHSATPELGDDYQRRVLAVWPEEKRLQAGAQPVAAPPNWATAMPAAPSNRVAVMLPVNRAETIRIVPLSAGGNTGAVPSGRSLDVYRATPIAIASGINRRGG